MAWSVTTAPVPEPVTLADAKLHLRIDSTDDDTLITALIKAARENVEASCERALMPQSWTERLDSFPQRGYCGPVVRPFDDRIYLRGGVVSAVTSVKYIDVDGVEQTLDPLAYVANLTAEPATIAPVYGTSWPATRDEHGSVSVLYAVGYTDADAVPASLKAAILLIVGDLYANRTKQQDVELFDNRAVSRLLFPYKRVLP